MQFSRIILGSLLNRITYSALCWQVLSYSRLNPSSLTHVAVFPVTYSAALDRYYYPSFIYSVVYIGRYSHHHPFGGVSSHVFCRPRQVLSLTSNPSSLTHVAIFSVTYSAVVDRCCHFFLYSAIGRYCHRHPFGSISSYVFCRPRQVLSLTLHPLKAALHSVPPTVVHLGVSLTWRLLHCIVILWWHHLLGLHHTVTLGWYHWRLWIHHTGILWWYHWCWCVISSVRHPFFCGGASISSSSSSLSLTLPKGSPPLLLGLHRGHLGLHHIGHLALHHTGPLRRHHLRLLANTVPKVVNSLLLLLARSVGRQQIWPWGGPPLEK